MTRRAFFLGAGFSKALNPQYPTLAELTSSVAKSFLERYSSGAIREHFNHLPIGVSFDIEQLLSFLHSDWPWKSSIDRDLDNALYKVLVYEVAVAITDIPNSKISNEYRQFIQHLRVTDTNTIISVNYDNLINEYRADFMSTNDYNAQGVFVRVEERFESNRKTSEQHPWLIEETDDTKSPVRIVFAREWMENTTVEDFVAIFSLNGFPEKIGGQWKVLTPESIWLYFTREEPFHKRKKFEAYPPPDMANQVLHLHGALHWGAEPDSPTIRVKNVDGEESLVRLPGIVPPVMDKSQHYAAGRLKQVWNAAHAAIHSAEEIIVIGFSFPPTDISCQFLFKSAIREGARIVVINRDPGIITRYQAAFGAIPGVSLDFSFVKNGDPLLEYINAEVLKCAVEKIL